MQFACVDESTFLQTRNVDAYPAGLAADVNI